MSGARFWRRLQNTKYFKVTDIARDEAEFDHLLASGRVLFGIEVPAGFERAVRRGDRPALLVAADATDPVAAGAALGALSKLVQTALRHDRPFRKPARRRSRSARMPATIRRARASSTSCRG